MSEGSLIEGRYRFFAFISYKREDEEWAKWLQHKLEHYRLPSNLNGRTDLPREIRPVFKDTSELMPGNLPEQIHQALDASKYLIVICSPRSAQSEWVNKEVETFISMGRTQQVIPFIIEGTAFAKDAAEECFPQVLRSLPEEQEILGANINEMGRDAAAVKVVARMFDVRFDELWQRREREQRRRRRLIIAAVSAFVLAVIGVAGWIWHQNVELKEANWSILENRARFVSKEANSLTENDDPYTASLLALNILPEDMDAPDKPFVPEAEGALRTSLLHRSHTIRIPYLMTVAFSPDDKTLVSVGNEIKVWDVNTGVCIKTFGEDLNSHHYVSFSPDGKRIVTATHNDVKVWDVSSGRCLHTLKGHESQVSTAVYSPDGEWILSTSEQGERVFCCWDASTGECLDNTDVGDYRQAFFSSDGSRMVTLSDLYGIQIWDTSSDWAQTIEPEGKVTSVSISPNGKQVVCSTTGGDICLYDANTGECLKKLYGGESVNCVLFSSDGNRMVSAGNNNVMVWDKATGERLHTINWAARYIDFATMSHDGKRVASVSYNDGFNIYEVSEKNQLLKIIGKGYPCASSISPDGNRIALASDSSCISVYDAITGRFIQTIERINHVPVASLFFSNDGKRINVVDDDGTVSVYDMASKDLVWRMEKQIDSSHPVLSSSLSQDGNCLGSIRVRSGIVQIWDLEKRKCVQQFEDKEHDFNCISLSSDGKMCATGAQDINGYVFDTKSGKCHLTLKGHSKEIFSIAFSPDDRKVVTGSADNTIRIWDMSTGKCLHVLEGHTDQVISVSFSPDGKYIVSGSQDNTMRVWNADNGCCLQTTSGGSLKKRIETFQVAESYPSDIERILGLNDFHHAVFFHEGHRLMTSSDDGSVMIWNFPSIQQLIDETRERFTNRQLTPEERRKYYLE